MISSKNNGYFHSLDLLRGIASISVTLFHFVIENRFSYNSFFRDLFSFGHLGVQVFFVISGFVIPYSMYKGKYNYYKIIVFFKKRLVRLEPPYITSIFLIFLINYIFFLSPYWHEDLLNVNSKQVILHLGYLNSFFQEGWLNQVYWSLGIEFQFYILIAFLFPLIIKNVSVWYLVLTILNLISCFISYESLLFSHLPYFALGITLFRFFTLKDSYWVLIISSLQCILIILLKTQFNLEFVFAFVVPFPFFFFIKNVNKLGRFLGEISYSLYLIHIPIGQRVIKIGVDFTSNVLSETVLIILALLISIFCSYIMYILIEKPTIEFTKRFKYGS